jgi:hypothetical protein
MPSVSSRFKPASHGTRRMAPQAINSGRLRVLRQRPTSRPVRGRSGRSGRMVVSRRRAERRLCSLGRFARQLTDTVRRNRCVPILVTRAPMFRTNPEAEAPQATQPHTGSCRGESRWLSVGPRTRFGAPEQRPTPLGANMIGAIRCTRTTPLAQPRPCSLRCCGRFSAGCSGR